MKRDSPLNKLVSWNIKPGIYSEYTPGNNLCYTDRMQKVRSFWSEWAYFLHRFGLAELAAAFLEAAGPLSVFMAQLLYAGQPFASGRSVQRMEALVAMFEDPEERQSFAAFLREESTG